MSATTAAAPFTFEDATVPVETRGGRKAEPNPYTDVVSALHALVIESGTVSAKAFHLPVKGMSEKEAQSEASKAVRQLRAVGAEDYTVRTKVEDSSIKDGKETVPSKRVTFWIHTQSVDGT